MIIHHPPVSDNRTLELLREPGQSVYCESMLIMLDGECADGTLMVPNPSPHAGAQWQCSALKWH